MADITFEQVLRGIQSLPPEALAKLREILNAPSDQEQGRKPVALWLARLDCAIPLPTDNG